MTLGQQTFIEVMMNLFMKKSRWSAEPVDLKALLEFQAGSLQVASGSFDHNLLEIEGLFHAMGQKEGGEPMRKCLTISQIPKDIENNLEQCQ